MNITRRQSEVLDFIVKFIQANSFAPTYEEIGAGVDLKSISTVHKHVTELEARGRIRRVAERQRSIEVLREGDIERFIHDSPERLWDNVLKCYWVKEIVP